MLRIENYPKNGCRRMARPHTGVKMPPQTLVHSLASCDGCCWNDVQYALWLISESLSCAFQVVNLVLFCKHAKEDEMGWACGMHE